MYAGGEPWRIYRSVFYAAYLQRLSRVNTATLARALIGFRDFARLPGVEIHWCPNASVMLVEVQEDGTGLLRKFGDISHLVKPVVVGNADELNDSVAKPSKC